VLLLVGDGPEQEALRRRAQATDRAGRVIFTGALPHDMVPAYVRRFDIAVAPYRPMPDFYFHPLKIAEYLAAGVPVVYPDQGGLHDLVGDAGLGYPPGSCERLADRLIRLLSEHTLRRDMAEAAQRRGDELDWRGVAERVLTFAAEPVSATGSSRS
jgi:glycosyltransferase involved in cell wall biosynthesis